MTEEHSVRSGLWKGVQAVFEGVRGSDMGWGRDRANYSEDGYTVTCHTDQHQADGTKKVYRVSITVTEEIDHLDSFWGPGGYIERENIPEHKIARIGGHHYVIEPDTDGGFQGMGGRKFTIDFFDGRSVVTRNLWSQGVIPPKWRSRHPDNAEFRSAEKVATAGGGHAWSADSDKKVAVSQEAWEDLLKTTPKQSGITLADLAESSKAEQAADTGVFDSEYMFHPPFEDAEWDEED